MCILKGLVVWLGRSRKPSMSFEQVVFGSVGMSYTCCRGTGSCRCQADTSGLHTLAQRQAGATLSSWAKRDEMTSFAHSEVCPVIFPAPITLLSSTYSLTSLTLFQTKCNAHITPAQYPIYTCLGGNRSTEWWLHQSICFVWFVCAYFGISWQAVTAAGVCGALWWKLRWWNQGDLIY